MRTLLLVLLFIAVPLAGGSLKPEQESDFWMGTGVDLAFAKSLINDRDCISSIQYFNSCRSALMAGARLLKVDDQKEFSGLRKQPFSSGFKFEMILAKLLRIETALPVEFVIGKMINVQLRVFDRFARLIPRSFYELLSSGASKTFFGSGLETESTAAGLLVFRVLPNTPAEQAGLQVHDRIVSLNGVLAQNIEQSQALANVLWSGKGGDIFNVVIERQGAILPAVEMKIAPIVMPEIEDREIEFLGKNYLQIRLRSFSRGICARLSERIQSYVEKQGPDLHGLILDLRHNLGGLVDEGECVARLFVGSKRVVAREPLRLSFPSVLDFSTPQLPDNSRSESGLPVVSDIPLIILVNAQTASASEIVAGALQDYARAWVIGERSYGKGITQVLHNLRSHPQLIVSKTVSRYVRPMGLDVHTVGVTPNFIAPYRADASQSARRFLREENARSAIKLPIDKRWVETRGREVGDIHLCLKNKDYSVHAEVAVKERFGYADHQTAFALSTFSCQQP